MRGPIAIQLLLLLAGVCSARRTADNSGARHVGVISDGDVRRSHGPQPAGNSSWGECQCSRTSGDLKSCCSAKDHAGMGTGDFCGSAFEERHCGGDTPICCTSRTEGSTCCPTGSTCASGCNGGGGYRDHDFGGCGCVPAPVPSNASALYDPVMATAMAELSSAAYCGEDGREKLLGWTCEACSPAGFTIRHGTMRTVARRDNSKKIAEGVFAFVARLQKVSKPAEDFGCVLAIRGTSTLANWERDLLFIKRRTQDCPVILPGLAADTCANCSVHKGFSSVWRSLNERVPEPVGHEHDHEEPDMGIVDHLKDIGCGVDSGKLVFVTGHSMGAAVATLAAYDLKLQGIDVALSYNFESPRLGNVDFANHFESLFDGPVSQFRITHLRDPVVQIPPRKFLNLHYRHVGAEVFFYPSWTMKEYAICEDPEDEVHACSKRNRFSSKTIISNIMSGHCETALISNNGAFCTWPEFCRS